MKPKRILICNVQVQFVYGGANQHIESLRLELVKRGYQAEVVSLPFKINPRVEIIKHALAWRLLELSETPDGGKVDMVITTRFPTWAVRHPNKVAWILHQFRDAYDLYGTKYGELTDSEEDSRIREMIVSMDNNLLPESRRIFTNSRKVAERMKKFNNIDGIPLYHPPPHLGRYRCDSYGDYVLAVSRLERHKRVDLLIEAMKQVDRRVKCYIAGTGSKEEELKRLVEKNSLGDRVKLLGFVSDEELLKLYAECFCVCFAPYDEDYGYVTLEAFLSKKPVITTNDSGGVLEFVKDGVSGLVVNPKPEEIAGAINKLLVDKARGREFGERGFREAEAISWDEVIANLIS